ncbi:MAG: hypothetical protein IPO51_02010 [Dehalococcoidia bacterium]|nr:hypothetical protein [Dehalococcoidia bacterium]
MGRGVGSEEAFREYFVEGLASALGAACGGSRGAVDMGIISPELQIGLTGRVVSPRLYHRGRPVGLAATHGWLLRRGHHRRC